jgi:hypothetical protein
MRRAVALGIFLALVPIAPASADELPSPLDLDGWYVTLGPLGAAVDVAGKWVSAAGGELSVAHLAEAHIPAVLGLCVGGVSYGSLAGGRLWFEGEVGLERPLPFALGIGVGVAAEVATVGRTHLGVQATLWAIGGLVPYVRVGALETTGGFFEAGVMFKVPIRFAY